MTADGYPINPIGTLFYIWLILRACLHGVGDPGLVGLVSFCFHALGDTKQKKLTPLDRGRPLHVNRV